MYKLNFDSLAKSFGYISFDVFDTLIKRNVAEPADVFRLIELEHNRLYPQEKISDFYEKRRLAQRCAKEQSVIEEITLNEIYDVLTSIYGNTKARQLKELEVKIELDICIANLELISFYRQCIDDGKTVLLISDMYLPTKTIELMLRRCGIAGYDKLYLSSEIKLKKRTGNLFRYVLGDMKIKPKQLFHIGDNKRSDFLRPSTLGIRAYWIPTKRNHLNYYSETELATEQDFFSYRTMSAFINNHLPEDKNPYWKVGYEVLGPLLYAYTKWLIADLKGKSIEKVFFLSRDGFIMKKAFDILCDSANNRIESTYLYVSRRSLVLPAICAAPQWSNVCRHSIICRAKSIRELLGLFNLDFSRYEDIVLRHGLGMDVPIDISKNSEQLANFYEDIKEDVIVSSKKACKGTLSFLKQNNFSGRVAIVDLGWAGSIQHAIQTIVDYSEAVDVTGYYMAISPQNNYIKGTHINGYLYQPGQSATLWEKLTPAMILVESMFMAPHGSVKSYELDTSGIVHPCLLACEFSQPEGRIIDELSMLENLHDGALFFIRDFYSSLLAPILSFSPTIVTENIVRLGIRPQNRDVRLFGKIRYHNIRVTYLVEGGDAKKYILHPIKLFTDFKKSIWRIGFLKSLIKLPLPYGKIYIFAKKLFRK